MKTFEDIIWKKHEIYGAIQGNLSLTNEIEISIVAGEGMYCSPPKNLGHHNLYSSFEVEICDNLGFIVDGPKGWLAI